MHLYQDILFYKVHTQIYLHTYSQQKHVDKLSRVLSKHLNLWQISKWFRKGYPLRNQTYSPPSEKALAALTWVDEDVSSFPDP